MISQSFANYLKTAATAVVFIALSHSTANAEGYQVNTLSARQNGMAHTGVAIPLGAESMSFNPAGMTYMDKIIDFSGSFTAVIPHTKAILPDDTEYENARTTATPINIGIASKINKDWAVGITFYTPYGSNIDWTDNWPGAELSQRVKLSMYTVQPTLAWSPVKNLSIGAGLMITWGSVDLQKGLVSGSSMDVLLSTLGQDFRFGSTVPASVRLTGKSQIAVGANIGLMYRINSQWTVGSSWRSQQTVKMRNGKAQVIFANKIAQNMLENKLGLINAANFKSQMPAPWVLAVGASYRPTDRWLLAFDAQLTGWKAYDWLNIDFLAQQLTDFSQHIKKNYHNAMTYKLGAQYSVTKRTDVRLGLMIDTTPVDDQFYNPETPGCTKIAPSAGISYRPLKNLSIDASVLYVQGLNRTGSCTYKDMLLGTEKNFTARYHVTAWAPSIGVHLSF